MDALSVRDRAVARRWCYWARSVDNDLLSRCYALCVAPRRLALRADGDGERAEAALGGV